MVLHNDAVHPLMAAIESPKQSSSIPYLQRGKGMVKGFAGLEGDGVDEDVREVREVVVRGIQ